MAASSDGSDFEDWDDETKLIQKFQDESVKYSSPLFSTSHFLFYRKTAEFEQTSLADLAHRLEGPMEANSEHLKQYLAHTLGPAARQVKEVHKAFDEKVDVGFG